MPRFFFDISDKGDVYHDARGVILHGNEAAKERALEIVRKLLSGPLQPGHRNVACTVRDAVGTELIRITVEYDQSLD